MSDADDLEEIRRRKREELESRVVEGDAEGDTTDPATPDEPIHVESADHLREFVDSGAIVLGDFYADWCGPCQMLDPVVADVARETDAAVLKVDVDAHQDLAAQYGVRGVPTLVLFAGGDPVERLVGVQEKSRLVSLIRRRA